MPDVLIAYASTHGHTRKIAEHLARACEERRQSPRLADLRTDDRPDPLAFDRVVVAASLHMGKHQPEVVDWIRRHRTALNDLPSAFLSVSLTAADDSDEAQQKVREIIDGLLTDTGWTPGLAQPVPGAFEWSRYNLPTRVAMKLIARKHGAPEGPEDVVYTDWDAVTSVADALLAQRRPAHAA